MNVLHQLHLHKLMRPHYWLYLVIASLYFLYNNTTNLAGANNRPHILLFLPSQAIITLVNGQSISGVNIAFLDQSTLKYIKGGNRTLSLSDVRSISFRELKTPQQWRLRRMRGGELKKCRENFQLKTNSRALRLQDRGKILAVEADGLNADTIHNLLGQSFRNELIVTIVRFNSSSRVLIQYKLCTGD
jgi:hypothetical protein